MVLPSRSQFFRMLRPHSANAYAGAGLDPLLQRMPPVVTVAWEQLAAATAPIWHPLELVPQHVYAHGRLLARRAWHHAQPHVQPLTDAADAQLLRHLSVSQFVKTFGDSLSYAAETHDVMLPALTLATFAALSSHASDVVTVQCESPRATRSGHVHPHNPAHVDVRPACGACMSSMVCSTCSWLCPLRPVNSAASATADNDTDAALSLCLSQVYRPWQIALLACVLALLVARVLARAGSVRVAVRERGALQTVFDGLKSLPIIHGIVRDQQEKLVVGRSTHCLDSTFTWVAHDVTYQDFCLEQPAKVCAAAFRPVVSVPCSYDWLELGTVNNAGAMVRLGLLTAPGSHRLLRCPVQQKIRDGMQKTFAPGDEPLLTLPPAGVSADDLRKKLTFKVGHPCHAGYEPSRRWL